MRRKSELGRGGNDVIAGQRAAHPGGLPAGMVGVPQAGADDSSEGTWYHYGR
jgi:hypothetical protein